jgi:hypothetical protein
MDIIKDTPVVRWLARIFLIVVVIGIIWWFFTKTDKYEYTGIQEYHKDHTFINQLIKNFAGQKKKPKQPRINKTEEICRTIIQKIYHKPFPSVRPTFLRSPVTKKNLELDCYNEELRIALEYNGQQHYTYTPYFHKTKKNFYSQVHRDDWKRARCRELGIRLIEVPYWVTPIDLEDYIVRELKKKGCL